MSIDPSFFLYWLLAAVVLAPIVLIVKGIAAGERKDKDKQP
ncbi:MAG TPA: hypothetical protein VF816_04385 [Rhodocyclaceae bacterium]